jgi:hypothetical protein
MINEYFKSEQDIRNEVLDKILKWWKLGKWR